MKVCKVCVTEKPLVEFSKKDSNKDGRHTKCNACRRQEYQENRILIRTKANRRNRANKLRAIKYKGTICIRCGEFPHPAAMEFHHINPKEKEFTIAQYAICSWKKFKPELDKCILVCANCHRIIHAEIKENQFGDKTPI